MNKSKLLWAFFALATIFTSCTRNDADETSYADTTIVALETETRTGRGGCFELVFPVTISLPDQTLVEITSYQNLRETIIQWRKDNPDFDRKVRSQFVYPIDVITKEGELITVTGREQLRELYKDCKRENFGHGKPCFKLNYPISLIFPDGSTKSYADAKELRQGLREWRRSNTDIKVRPHLVFPMTITLEDGSSIVVNTKEELHAIKEDCK
jgi:hypothetical protein